MIDERNYTVTCINGFRRGCLSKSAGISLVRKMNEQLKRLGWNGKARLWYRDGSEVKVP